jgi:hypothetical protein
MVPSPSISMPLRPSSPAHARTTGLLAVLARAGKRVVVTLVGGTVALLGVAMLVLPGPGLLTLAVGFGILGQEYAWAARINDSVRARLVAAGRAMRSQRGRLDVK